MPAPNVAKNAIVNSNIVVPCLPPLAVWEDLYRSAVSRRLHQASKMVSWIRERLATGALRRGRETIRWVDETTLKPGMSNDLQCAPM